MKNVSEWRWWIVTIGGAPPHALFVPGDRIELAKRPATKADGPLIEASLGPWLMPHYQRRADALSAAEALGASIPAQNATQPRTAPSAPSRAEPVPAPAQAPRGMSLKDRLRKRPR